MKSAYEVIVLAAGAGERMGAACNKVLLPLADLPIFAHALCVFMSDDYCEHVILVIREDDKQFVEEMLKTLHLLEGTPLTLAYGGSHRQKSVYEGLKKLRKPEEGLVMVHDAARPFIRPEDVDRLNEKAAETDAALLAVPAKDTTKVVQDGIVKQTLFRPNIWQVQTPQAFSKPVLLKAHEEAQKEDVFANEEGELVERLGMEVAVVKGSYDNIKITTPEDFVFAEGILAKRK